MSTGELLERWREATRAAELAEKLAELAKESVERADRDALGAREIAEMAEQAAEHAERAAKVAREAADRALAFASENRSGRMSNADDALKETRAEEVTARDLYHEAERVARERLEPERAP